MDYPPEFLITNSGFFFFSKDLLLSAAPVESHVGAVVVRLHPNPLLLGII
jgi:hypothetical protein